MLKLHPHLEAVFVAWDRADLSWCLLRVPRHPLAPSSDVDLLVDQAHAPAASRSLARLGFERLPGWGYGSDAFFLGRDRRASSDWLWLHVASALAFGPYQVLRVDAERGCLARRRRIDGIHQLAPSDAFWSLLAHCLLDKQRVPAHHRATLQQLAPAAREEGELPDGLTAVCPPTWDTARLLGTALGGDWQALEAVAPAMVEACLERQPPGRTLKTRAARAASRAGGLAHPAVWQRYWSRR